MKRGRRVVTAFAVLVLLTFLPQRANAQYGQYGAPSPTKEISIEKLVEVPGSSDFVNNLSLDDPRFKAGQVVVFKLVVTNPSDQTLNDVTVTDQIPDFLEPMEGPGNFDKDSREISFSAGDLAPGEKKEFILKMKVVSQENLPSDKSVVCVVNNAEASAEDVSDQSSSQVCIEKAVAGAQQVPATGPEMGALLLASQLGLFSAGIYLRRRTR